MNKTRVSFRFDDHIYNMLSEIVEEVYKSGESDIYMHKYTMSSAIRESIINLHEIKVTKDFVKIPKEYYENAFKEPKKGLKQKNNINVHAELKKAQNEPKMEKSPHKYKDGVTVIVKTMPKNKNLALKGIKT